MNRRPGFLIAIASAVITIGILFATVGKPAYLDKFHHKMECSKSNDPKTTDK